MNPKTPKTTAHPPGSCGGALRDTFGCNCLVAERGAAGQELDASNLLDNLEVPDTGATTIDASGIDFDEDTAAPMTDAEWDDSIRALIASDPVPPADSVEPTVLVDADLIETGSLSDAAASARMDMLAGGARLMADRDLDTWFIAHAEGLEPDTHNHVCFRENPQASGAHEVTGSGTAIGDIDGDNVLSIPRFNDYGDRLDPVRIPLKPGFMPTVRPDFELVPLDAEDAHSELGAALDSIDDGDEWEIRTQQTLHDVRVVALSENRAVIDFGAMTKVEAIPARPRDDY